MNPRDADVRITVLTVPDCPNAPVVRERIAAALAGRAVPVDWVEVADAGEAALRGMNGSPTALVDGSDPFAHEDLRPSLSCRLYHHGEGTTDGAPSVTELRRALAANGLAEPHGEE